jgi:hypothetical protein
VAIIQHRADGIDRRQTEVVLEGVGVRLCQVPNIPARGRRYRDRHLHRRITGNHIAPYDIPGDAGSQIDAVGVPENRIVFDDVVVSAGRDDADAEVVGLCSEPVSCYPVPTEPVASRGAGQSYASARVGVVPVADRDAVFDVVGGRAGDEDAG